MTTPTPGTNAPGQTPLSPQALELTKPVTPTLLDKSGDTVGELDFSIFGAVSVRMVDNQTVDIPPARRAAFAQEVAHFSALPNTKKRELVLPSAADANLLRAQLKSYAREHDLNVAFPVEDKFGRRLNDGAMITYRIAPRTESDASKNGAVTVSSVANQANASKAGADKSAADAVLAASKAK